MSAEDEDQIAGRIVREHAERKRKLAALESELRRFATAFKNLADGLGHNVSPTFSLNVVERAISEPPLNEIDFSKLVAFLREYTEVRERHTAGEEEIRKLGI